MMCICVGFVAAILLSGLVLLTPFDTVARTQLFAAHMVQAVVLTTLCAPLLLASCHNWLLQPVLEHPVFRHVLRALTRPLIASIIFNLTFLAWHAPAIFDAAQRNEVLYQLEMLSFLFTALLNWWPLIGPSRELRRLSYPQQMLYAFLDGQPVDIYAFLLVFTGTVFYKQYVLPLWFTQAGLSAVALGFVLNNKLLVIPGLVDLVVMSPLFFRWLGQLEQQAKLADQKRQEEAEEAEAENARREAEEAEKVGGMEKSEMEA